MPKLHAALTACGVTLLMAHLGLVGSAQAYEPPGHVECLAPANPGGGWDFTCRSMGRVMSALGLVSGNVQTVNMPGASGGVGFAHVVKKRDGDEGLFTAASTVTTTGLALNQFPGLNADMVQWVGTLGADYGVIAVGPDSPYQNLKQLFDALKEDPKAVSFAGGTAMGGWDHLKMLLTAKAAGVDQLRSIRYLGYNGGGEALTQVIGGHTDAFAGDITEALGFAQAGQLRILAVLSEERLPGELSDIPTAREQGIDVTAPNWRGFYVPKGIPDEAYQWWVDLDNKLYTSDEWQAVMKQNGLMPFHKSGKEFNDFVHKQISDIHELGQQIGLIQ